MKIALVCSHGGHLTQMNMLTPAFEGHERFWVTYRCVRTEAMAARERVCLLTDIGVNPVRMALAFFRALWILLKERPNVVVSTGAEIAIPFSWVASCWARGWSTLRPGPASAPAPGPVPASTP